MRVTPGGQIIFADYQYFVKTEVKTLTLQRTPPIYIGDATYTFDTEFMWKLRGIGMMAGYSTQPAAPVKFVWGLSVYIEIIGGWKSIGLYASHGEFTHHSPFWFDSVNTELWIPPTVRVFIWYGSDPVDYGYIEFQLFFDAYRR